MCRLAVVLWAFIAAASAARSGRADYVRLLSDDLEAVQARIDLIQQAQHEICVSYFIIDRDETPLGFLALLRDAARRGVTVRLLIDGRNNEIPGAVQAHLLAEGVDIREYHPPTPCKIRWVTHRLHDKLLITDCQQLITGGRNIKDEYYGHDHCVNFRDLDVYDRGCAACEGRNYFMCIWNSCDVRPTRITGRRKEECPKDPRLACLEDGCNPFAIYRAARLLDEFRERARTCDVLKWESGADWSAGLCDIPCVWLLHNDCPVGRGPGEVRDDIFAMIDRASHSILIETPYLVLTARMKRHIAAARWRGVWVGFITNSLATNNHPIAHAGYMNQKRWLLRHGIEIWEYAGPLQLHTKAALFDGRLALVGTYNFDPLSENLNLEDMLAVNDCAFAAQLRVVMLEDQQNSWRIGRFGRAMGTGMRHPGATPQEVRKLHVLRIFAPLVKKYL